MYIRKKKGYIGNRKEVIQIGSVAVKAQFQGASAHKISKILDKALYPKRAIKVL